MKCMKLDCDTAAPSCGQYPPADNVRPDSIRPQEGAAAGSGEQDSEEPITPT